MSAKEFWNRVKELLKNKKSTQRELAEYIGMPLRTLENWMFRGLFPLIIDGYIIAKFFNVSVDFLITGKEKKDQANITAIRSLLSRADEKLGML